MALECQRLSLTNGSVTAQVSWFGRLLETSPEAAEGHGRHRSARGIATVGGTFALITVSLHGMNARQAGTALVGSALAPGAAVPMVRIFIHSGVNWTDLASMQMELAANAADLDGCGGPGCVVHGRLRPVWRRDVQ